MNTELPPLYEEFIKNNPRYFIVNKKEEASKTSSSSSSCKSEAAIAAPNYVDMKLF
jgi:hypothetical protein